MRFWTFFLLCVVLWVGLLWSVGGLTVACAPGDPGLRVGGILVGGCP